MAAKYVVIICVFTFKALVAECRVVCQDLHSTRWITDGVSCTVNCAILRAAIKKLRMVDAVKHRAIHTTLTPQWLDKVHNIEDDEIYAQSVVKEQVMREIMQYETRRLATNNDIAHGNEKAIRKYMLRKPFNGQKGMSAKKNRKLLQKELYTAVSETFVDNGTCAQLLKKFVGKPTPLLMRIISKCTKRSDGNDYVTKITDILNTYGKTKQFDDNTTMLILKQILSLRQGTLDPTVMSYLNNATLYDNENQTTTEAEQTITLAARRCVNINVPGCFCRKGFVEDRGQCVYPIDCLVDKKYATYLHRIIIHN